uniref:F-box/LRR-repeat protein 15/At3g58940/PEG3-like LRR domain-containing protein n=1 Tax=Chenopodium quinoa TaxID=63459 RepID=A0A803L7G0_CHEQI
MLLTYNKAVTDILLSHVGPICKFVLFIPLWFPEETDFSSWLRFVYDNGVKEIALEDVRRPARKFPTCLFSFFRLTHLTLLNCKLGSLSPTFRGFPCLISLKFSNYYVKRYYKTNVLTNLISKCPLIECLHIFSCNSFGTLTIRAPKLREFVCRVLQVSDVSLEETTAIEVLCLHIYCGTLQQSKNTNDFFSCLANVKRLSLWHLSCSLLAIELAKSRATTIETIRYGVESGGQLNQFDASCMSCIFQCLKTVDLVGITGLSNELKLIRFLLACTPVQDEMTIKLGMEMRGTEKQVNFFKELNQYRRASPNAEMIFKT